MFALITAALNGLAALPKLIEFFESLQIAARLDRIEQNQAKIREAYDKLAQAKTPEEIQSAAHHLSAGWNHP